MPDWFVAAFVFGRSDDGLNETEDARMPLSIDVKSPMALRRFAC